MAHAFGVVFKSHRSNQGHLDFILCSLLGVLQCSIYIYIYNPEYFCERCNVCIQTNFILFFACGCIVFPALFVIFYSLYYFFSVVNDQLTTFMWTYFWFLYSLIYLSLLLPIPPHLSWLL